MKLLSACSSTQRPQILQRMIATYVSTTKTDDAKLAIYVSKDDPKIDEYRALTLPPRVEIEYGPKKNLVQVLNYFCTEKYPDCDYYHEVNDDHEFKTVGWDVIMMAAVNRKNKGVSMVYGQTRQYPTAVMFGGKMVRGLGYLFPPIFTHNYVDTWLIDICAAANAMAYVPNVLIDHVHPVFELAAWDNVYRAGADEGHHGKAVYEKWVKTSREADIAKLKALIAKHADDEVVGVSQNDLMEFASQDDVRAKMLAKLPPDFGPMHPMWKVPSYRHRYLIAMGQPVGYPGTSNIHNI